MFVGHYGIGFALKKADPALSLGILFLAVQLPDLIWPILVYFGIEKVAFVPGFTSSNAMDFVYYPYSHSLLASLIWGTAVFLAFILVPSRHKGNKLLGGIILGIAVISHFLLDLIVHVPDLPLAEDSSPKIGFGLWNYRWLSLAVESVIYFGGLWIYLGATSGKKFGARWGIPIFAGILYVMFVMTSFGPPPPDTKKVAIGSIVIILTLAAIAFWLDRKRLSKTGNLSIRKNVS